MNEARFIGAIAKGVAYLLNGVIDAVLEVNESVVAPKLFLNLLSSDKLTGSRSEKDQELEGLGLELDQAVALAQFAGMEIRREGVEAEAKLGSGACETMISPSLLR